MTFNSEKATGVKTTKNPVAIYGKGDKEWGGMSCLPGQSRLLRIITWYFISFISETEEIEKKNRFLMLIVKLGVTGI